MKEAKSMVKQILDQMEKERTTIWVISGNDEVLLIKRHAELTIVLTRGSSDAAGYNLYSAEKKSNPVKGKALFDTQISIVVPPGTYGHIAPQKRS